MSDEYTGPGRDASASTDGSRPVQHPVAAYAGASAPTDPGTHPGAARPAGPPPGAPYGAGCRPAAPRTRAGLLRRHPALQRPAEQRPADPAQPAPAAPPARTMTGHRGRGPGRRPGRWRRRVRRRLRAARRRFRRPAADLVAGQLRSAAAAAPGSVAAAAQKAMPSTVDLRVEMAQGVAEGSGVVLTADGNVLTNNHVVAGARTISVTLSDGSEHPATVVGTAPSYDLAVVKLQGVSGLTPAMPRAERRRPGRPAGGGDRLAAGPHRHRDHRHRQRLQPHRAGAGRGRLRRGLQRPADRHPDQPGQLRRPAGQPGRAR